MRAEISSVGLETSCARSLPPYDLYIKGKIRIWRLFQIVSSPAAINHSSVDKAYSTEMPTRILGN